MRHGVLGALLAGLLVGALLALGGCTDPQSPSFVEFTVGKLTVVRPAAWTTQTPVDLPWTLGYRLAPNSIEQIQVSGDFGEYATAAEAVGTLIGQAQVSLAEFTVVETRDVDVAGGTTAQVVRYTITDNTDSQVFGEWIVAAHWPDPQSVAVSILTSRYDVDLERQVLESMRMRPNLS
jgi:hypothetical protein